MVDFDQFDARILNRLQFNATDTVAELANLTGLSSNACWRRVKNLEAAGVIRQRVALLDAAKLNLGTTVFVSIRTNQHNEVWLKSFSETVIAIPEVVEFYRMSGKVDYLLKIVVSDIPHYDRVYRKLIRLMSLYDVNSNFAMEQLKCTTVLPLSQIESRS
ncbi:Lrp/AsnC family transcriptional regulator (plasmid) [Lichenicola cladoniae]|uniref:Lrp/AsnC family transcriptional regulator n=1 Tax=Lichenicola cladoniae TaxID=1484109 RepID=A0A6M8HZ89_9PROT|nr:Lrp/AsnC family transcriptional regulator [Lichenicola cladoniae]NPD69868.1 Lrp/AsnC family transcriptional regulator [Acetobacteraceae bacterium]QKE93843.1 Lrp/AsnC family transcriptional regulator [Lichenicola cladoniae]